ncbi:MAG TPA: NADH-quinone oxidoreductase subunit L, partial [Pseudomonadota bacterium]|nr:NADH-quinone oxidoreductase subunit L [Pseudomonadota bacterium]
SGGDPLPIGDRLGPSDFAEMAETAFKPVYSLDPDPIYLRIWGGIRDFVAAVGRVAAARVERHAPVAVAACTAGVCVGVWLL